MLRKRPNLELLAAITGTCVIFAVFFAGCPYGIDRYSCHRSGKAVKRPTQYSLWTGCLVQTDKGLIPFKQWRAE